MRLINIIIAVILFMGNTAFADYKAGKAAYDAGDYQTAYNEWLPLAEAGNIPSQVGLGHLYWYGKFVSLNYKKAEIWFIKGALHRDPSAAYSLGQLYSIKQNDFKTKMIGMRWICIASLLGYPLALDAIAIFQAEEGLAQMLDKQMHEAKLWLVNNWPQL